MRGSWKDFRISGALRHLVAALVGFALGTALIANPLARMFAPATVAWDAASCPPGEYTVTSLARSLGGRERYLTTSTGVVLPQPTVVQEFPDLPPGAYAVSAIARNRDGQTFGSGVQTITVFDGSAPRSPLAGRRRPASAEPASKAKPRKGRDQSAPSSTGPQTQPATLSAPVATTGKTANRAPLWITVSDVEEILIRFGDDTDPAGDALAWRRVTLVDSDADGFTDAVLIETVTGDAWLIRVSR